MSPMVTRALEAFIMPPGSLILLLLLGLLVGVRHPRAGRWLGGAGVVLLYLLSMPLTATWLTLPLEESYPPQPPETFKESGAGAIVVLGGGRHGHAPEYDGETLNNMALERVRFAARVARASGLPLLVTGGSPFHEDSSEAELMAAALSRDFGLEARWVEGNSNTTWENATRSRELLRAAGIGSVILVTHAWHMARAAWSFRQAGFTVIPAPTLASRPEIGRISVHALLPGSAALARTVFILHERLGELWYRMRFG